MSTGGASVLAWTGTTTVVVAALALLGGGALARAQAETAADLAALAGVNPELHQAAEVDGANRLQRIRHVNVPAIMPTIVILFILDFGSFMSVGFEKVLLLYNPMTYSTGDVISTYLYRIGLQSGNFSYATAIGLFESLIGLALILSSNAISRRITGSSLW